MDELKSLDSLFKEKIFRIPDYQRGYAWQRSQLKDFWEDLINLPDDQSHYTGLLMLEEVLKKEIEESDNEYWLVEDHSYKMYQVVDGQQRLTTFVVFLQAFIDFVKQLDENAGKGDQEIYIKGSKDSLSLKNVIDKYLFMTKRENEYRTYKFGYTVDNQSDEYLRHEIFKEHGATSPKETFYTLNLKKAKSYFDDQLKELHARSGTDIGWEKIYEKLTECFLFNEYVIGKKFDVSVAFETINNRGKQLSSLELLKNRLIYLITLYPNKSLDKAYRKNLRDAINTAWKNVYEQLGRNPEPLNDDYFLEAHWIMYFEGNDHIKFLLDRQFSPQRVYKKTDNDNGKMQETVVGTKVPLQPAEIKEYASSLQESAEHWFNLHYPLKTKLSDKEKSALDRLNRIGMVYFEPLVMSVLKNEEDESKRIELWKHVERFIFIVFRLSRAQSNYKKIAFHNASTKINKKTFTVKDIKKQLDDAMRRYFHEDGKLNEKSFYDYLKKLFERRVGYYGWYRLRYFLYEYELHLLSQSKQPKLSWEFWTKQGDKISTEHVFPQTPTKNWQQSFASIDQKDYHLYRGSIGNLLLLPMSINASLQNDDFNNKKKVYLKGWHSGIDVAQNENWTPETIKERGLKLLNFMEDRWSFKFKDEQTKERLLFLNPPTVEY